MRNKCTLCFSSNSNKLSKIAPSANKEKRTRITRERLSCIQDERIFADESLIRFEMNLKREIELFKNELR